MILLICAASKPVDIGSEQCFYPRLKQNDKTGGQKQFNQEQAAEQQPMPVAISLIQWKPRKQSQKNAAAGKYGVSGTNVTKGTVTAETAETKKKTLGGE